LSVGALFLLAIGTTTAMVVACSSDNANQTTSSSGGNGSDILSPCDTCHTQDKTKRLAGGIHLSQYEQTTSAGRATLYSPNLTPDNDTGIGAWSDDELRFAIRDGVGKGGIVMCPPMQHYKECPDGSTSAGCMTPQQLDDVIKALRRLPPIKNKVTPSLCPPIKNPP
jgi:cytochrome c2